MPARDNLSRVLERERLKRRLTYDAFARLLGLGQTKSIRSFYGAILSGHRNFPKKKIQNFISVCHLDEEEAWFLIGSRQFAMRKLMLPDIQLSEEILLKFAHIAADAGCAIPLVVLLARLPELRKRGRS